MELRKNLLHIIEGAMYTVILCLFFFGKFALGVTDGAVSRSFSVLTFGRLVYCILGMLIINILSALVKTSFLYRAGKYFSYYLFCMLSESILLLSDTGISYMFIISGIISLLGNYFLYETIYELVFSPKAMKASYVKKIYTMVLFLMGIVYILGENHLKIIAIIISYIATVVGIIIEIRIKQSTIEPNVKKQIEFLSKGLAVGVIIFIIASMTPTIGIMESTNDEDFYQEKTVEYYSLDVHRQQADELRAPWLIYTGIIVAIIFIMEKRELLFWSNKKDIAIRLVSGIWIMVLDLILRIGLKADFFSFLTINSMIILPSCYIYNKYKHQYLRPEAISEKIQEERKAIAVYIHDSIIQDLIVLSYSIVDLQIKDHLKEIIKNIRKIGSDIYPTIVEDLGLEIAIEEAVENIREQYKDVNILYEYELEHDLVNKQTGFLIYRAARELMLNACKHAACDTIEVMVRNNRNHIQLTVRDDGHGFSMDELTAKIKKSHIGLKSLSNQVQKMGGIIKFATGDDGSCFDVII